MKGILFYSLFIIDHSSLLHMSKTASTATTRTRKRRETSATTEPRLQSQITNHKSEIGLAPATDKGHTTKVKGSGDVQGPSRQPDVPSDQSPIGNRQSAIQLLPYQRRWIEDDSKLKIVVKARQIGYSFACTLRVVFECLKRKTTWILLSKGERQSRLMMEKVQEHIQTCGILAQTFESAFFEGTTIKQLETRFPNGSVIYGLPANPDTARGYSGNVTLDEFAFHADAEKIYSALYPSITRGYSLEVISTPNGQQGKFYELARQAGLTEAETRNSKIENRLAERISNFEFRVSGSWSGHCVDIYDAVRQGLKIDLQLLRAGCEDDSAWRQEFGCQFVSTAENFFPPELLAACLSAEASVDTPTHLLARESDPPLMKADSAYGTQKKVSGARCQVPGKEEGFLLTPDTRHLTPEFFLGIDIGRRHDRTVFWVDEVANQKSEVRSQKPEGGAGFYSDSWRLTPDSSIGNRQSTIGNLSIARLVRTLSNVPFNEQMSFARHLLSLRGGNGTALIRRAAIDATGMGAPLAESLAQEFGPRVEPVVFTAAVKEDLAYRTKRRMENGLTLLPDARDIRRAFSAVKKFVTVSGNVRFDAARTDAGHSDEFWAKALADLAAETRPAAHLSDGYLADGKPIISPRAFLQLDSNFGQSLMGRVF